MGIGYVKVSKREQNPKLQRRELEAAGCGKILEERISSREETRLNRYQRHPYRPAPRGGVEFS